MEDKWTTPHEEVYNGRRILIMQISGMCNWFCGYVETLDKDNMDQYNHYGDIPIEVHWGVTYQGEQNGFSCIGWDSAHSTSFTDGFSDLDLVIKETLELADQLDNLITGVR